jgi:hypothetical protein
MILKKMIFIMAGVGLLAGAVWSGVMTGNFISHAKIADGVVVGLNAGGAHPQIQFTTAAGEKVAFPASGFIYYHVGERVKVFFLPADPLKHASLDAFGALWFAPVLLAFLGAGLLLGGCLESEEMPKEESRRSRVKGAGDQGVI